MWSSFMSDFIWAFEKCLEFVTTFLYRDLLKRNTLKPMMEIINEDDEERQRRLLRLWAQTKLKESSYIQLAGGFLFTTVASSLQWPGTQNGHWSATAFFYACLLLAFIAIVTGSQQLLLLPGEAGSHHDIDEMKDGHARAANESEKQYLRKVVERLRVRSHEDRPNAFQVYALQAPIMLLASSVMAFLAGMCSVVFAPLASQLEWNDNAKIAVVFSIAVIACIVVFFSSSNLINALFRLELDDHRSSMRSWMIITTFTLLSNVKKEYLLGNIPTITSPSNILARVIEQQSSEISELFHHGSKHRETDSKASFDGENLDIFAQMLLHESV